MALVMANYYMATFKYYTNANMTNLSGCARSLTGPHSVSIGILIMITAPLLFLQQFQFDLLPLPSVPNVNTNSLSCLHLLNDSLVLLILASRTVVLSEVVLRVICIRLHSVHVNKHCLAPRTTDSFCCTAKSRQPMRIETGFRHTH